MNNFFFKKWFLKKLKITHFFLIYYKMSSEIIESVADDNYDDFQHVNFIIFHTKFHFTMLRII